MRKSLSAGKSRQERRKAHTRERILAAALDAFGEHGLHAATINGITTAADVAFGSFFNYFSSKEAAFEAVKAHYLLDFGARLDRIADVVSDPAEVVAASTRHFFQRAVDDLRFAKLAARSVEPSQFLSDPMVQRISRDVAVGVQNGVFVVADPAGVVIAVLGVFFGFLQAITAKAIGPDAPQSVTRCVLALLGVSSERAQQLCALPLPPLPAGANWSSV